jgi:flagellar biosynthetic protein FliP
MTIEVLSGADPSGGVRLALLVLAIALGPAVLAMVTSFARIIVVLHFLRSALGTQQIPPNQVLLGLALFLTIFSMGPTLREVNDQALQPFSKGQITSAAIQRAEAPLRAFMFKHADERDVDLFVRLGKLPRPKTRADVPTTALIPAFIISELKTAFEIGFLIYLPFLVIDLVVASTLMSMGMFMLPPVLLSLPFKILLFILIDGWHLLAESLVRSFW